MVRAICVIALAMTITILSGAGSLAKEAAEESSSKQTEVKKEITKKVRLAHIKISGELPESPGQMTFFGDLGVDLRKTIARLDKAAKDSKIEGVILEIKTCCVGAWQAE